MKTMNVAKRFGAGIGLFVATTTASLAALPTEIGTALTEVETDGLALAGLVWPVLIALFGATLLMTLFKRFGRRI